VTDALTEAQGLLASGDVPGLMRHLRTESAALPLGEIARLTAAAAQLAGFDDLRQAAAAVAEGDGQDPQALYNFGYACTGHEVGYLAVRPLERALELAPEAGAVLSELVAALEQDGQHARAVTVLEDREPSLAWMNRFQYVYNALMAGYLDKAADGFGRLPEPRDPAWRPAREKVRRMLARAGAVRGVTPLDYEDLRGWHYVLTGGILETLSPYGFGSGMTGRYAYLADSTEGCAAALARLRLILETTGTSARAVMPLPDRASQILGTAAAAVLGLPQADLAPGAGAAGCLIVAYDLNAADPAAVTALRQRAPGQILFERATCWASPPQVTADVTGLLAQVTVPPWEPHITRLDDGTIGPGPADDRPAGAIAAEIAATAPRLDEGGGTAPPDSDEDLRRLAAASTTPRARERDGGWLGGLREYVPDAGPVPSTRFL
jgi:hypothetical protein